MDIAHHALIGGIGLAALSPEHYPAGVAFLAASALPDLDVAFMIFGKRFYLKHHQGITHSIVLSPLYAGLITGFFSIFIGFSWIIFISALIGFLIHYILDIINTFGISLFSPFSNNKYSFDAVFFIDFTMWIIGIIFFPLVYFLDFSYLVT